MVHLKSKTIRELNEKDLQDRLKQVRTDLFKLHIESKKGTLRKESGKLKPLRKDIARMLTRLNELKKKWCDVMTRNIGLPVKVNKTEPLKNEKNNPFNGSLAIHGKLFEGTVINAKAKGTIVIQKESPIYFSKFKRFGRSKNKIRAHVPSNLNVQEGDFVVAAECSPISKSVSFVVIEVKS